MSASNPRRLPIPDGANSTARLSIGEVQAWHAPAVKVDHSRILRVHKYRDESKVRKVIVSAAKDASERAMELVSVTGNYVILQIDSIGSDELILSTGHVLRSSAFHRNMQGCTHLLAFLITLGPTLDQQVIRLVETVFEPLDALFLETAGWLTIEAATREFSRHMKSDLGPRGYAMSLRMGPGYEYATQNGEGRERWNLEEQRILFDLFGDADLPVTLMKSCAMLPKMSRSGVYGLKPVN